MSTILETSRLRLRELVPDDLDFVATMLAHPDVTRYYEKRYTRDDAREWLERQLARYRRDGHGLWHLELLDGPTPVGQVGLTLQDVDGQWQPELGWLLHRPFWGFGYATEAAAAARDAAFTRWRYPRIISLIHPENLPSQRVAQRLGMTPGHLTPFHGMPHIVWGTDASALAGL